VPDGHLRHSRFVGLSEDKKPRKVLRELFQEPTNFPHDSIHLMIIFPPKTDIGNEAARYETPGSSPHVLFGYAQLASGVALERRRRGGAQKLKAI
jgi:hypothetical protein